MRRAGQEPGRAAPRAAGAGSGDGAAAERAVQAARGPVNGAADGGREAANRQGPAKALRPGPPLRINDGFTVRWPPKEPPKP